MLKTCIKFEVALANKYPTIENMLLLDFNFGGIVVYKEVLAHMLTAASLLIAGNWKSEEDLSLSDSRL